MNEIFLKYKEIAGAEAIDQLFQLAKPLHGIRITHVNSTASGGGVAEILSQMIPMTEMLGIQTRWEVIEASAEFYAVTKEFHNGLQGKKTLIPPSQLKTFESVNQTNAERLRDSLRESDVVVIHDPQPMGLINHFPDRKGKWIWRCHIDASRPFWPVWKYLSQFAAKFDASIFSLQAFAHPLPNPMFIIPPSIDPLSDKNSNLSEKEVQEVRQLFNLDPARPMILQVSRFDRFKDPLGVIQSYRLAKKFNPTLQLVLAGGGAHDDPEGEIVLNEVRIAAAGDPDIHILLLPNDANQTVNALQRAADIVLQKSIKEGFGLTVTEALWKGKPVIGGNTGGIKLQVINHQTGFVVNTPEGAAYWIRYLLQHREKGFEIGLKGREYVRQKFLLTRHLRDYLSVIYSLIFAATDRIELPKQNE
jgi:trehalose synthase